MCCAVMLNLVTGLLLWLMIFAGTVPTDTALFEIQKKQVFERPHHVGSREEDAQSVGSCRAPPRMAAELPVQEAPTKWANP